MKQFETKISTLIAEFIKGEIEESGLAELEDWIEASPENKRLFESLLQQKNFEQRLLNSPDINIEGAYRQLKQKIVSRHLPVAKQRTANWKLVSALAASVLIPLTIGIVFFQSPSKEQVAEVAVIEPGNHKAQLFFSTGEKIELDKNTSDTIYRDNTTVVANNGTLSYSNASTEEAQINKVVVPRGGEFQMTLADGTKVWLNSESELTFPTTFNGDTRMVEVVGEAYFKVAHSKKKPFLVKTAGQTVRVLGTEFNIRSYAEENNVATTLVEGSIELSSTENLFESIRLSPGEQTNLNAANQKLIKQAVHVDEFVSWKSGEYIFKSKPLVEVMNELARWYDLEVEFNDESIKKSIVTGKFKRTNTFNAFVELLDKIEVARFEITDNKVLISE